LAKQYRFLTEGILPFALCRLTVALNHKKDHIMKKIVTLALLSAFIAGPALADTTPAGVAGDVQNVQQDNGSIAKTQSDLAKDRAAKAQDKATGNWAGQAVDSVKIGGDKVTRSVKKTNKSGDQDNLNSDVNGAVNK
jgi:hypothetical protein